MTSDLEALVDDAFAAFEDGNLEGAIDAGRRALAVDPTDPDANHVLGAALLEAGEPFEAKPHLERAVEGDEENIDALVGLGTAHFECLDLARARSVLTLATELEPDNADAWFGLGLVVWFSFAVLGDPGMCRGFYFLLLCAASVRRG